GVNGAITLNVNGGTTPYSFNWSNGVTSQNISNLTSGTYIVTVTDANGCSANQTQSITQPSASLSASSSVNSQVSCFGGANGSINLTVLGGTAPYSYNWSNGANTQDINGLSSGTYSVTIADVNGCTAINSASVTQPSGALSASASTSQNVSCNSGSNGSITVSITGGTTPYTYVWSNGASTQNINSLNAGVFTITITDANGCTTIQSETVTQPTSALSATSSANQNVSCYGGANGAIALTVNGGTAPYSYNWSNGANTQNLSNLNSGTYTVSITDANGCTANQSQTVTQPSAGLSAAANASQNVSCNGGNNAAINVTVNGGTAPYTFNWSNGAATQNVNNLIAGTYTVTVTDAHACSEIQTVTITQPSAGLSANSTVTGNISCFSGNNGSIDLTVNGGTSPYSYDWNTGATIEDLSGLSAGNYSVTITDANGCTVIDNATITQPAGSLSTSISLTQGVLCNGGNNGSIDITATGGTIPYSYNWSNGATTEDISNLSAGTYTATITDVNGCFAGVTGTITQPSASLSASASVAQNVNCYAGTNGAINLTVNGGTSPYSYNWNNGATTQNISNISSGAYTVSITDANGCTQTANEIVTQPTGSLAATASVTQNVNCYAGANGTIDVTVNGGTTPYNYNWSNGATTQDLNNLSAGTYVVSITDANGCTSSQNGTVTQPSASLSATASTTQNVSCFSGANGSINLAVNGGTTPYTYTWSNGATTQNVSNLAAGTYTVSITDANGCSYSETGTISQPSGALTSGTSVTGNISCFSGNNGSIDLTVTGGTVPYNYNWSTGATTEDLINLSSGTYSVSITDANGCTSNSSATITQPAGSLSTNVAIIQQVSCYAGANGSINLTVNGGTNPYAFTWSNGSTLEDISNLSSGSYTVTITDANGCNASANAIIIQPSGALNASASISQNVSCYSGANGSIDLTTTNGTAPYSYSWSNGATTEDITGLVSGTYSVTITDANSCTTITSATISQPSGALNVNLNVSQNVNCYTGSNGSIDLTTTNGTAPYIFDWSNGATTEDISNLSAGTYSVTVTDANGCTSVQNGTITQPSTGLSAFSSANQNVSCYGGVNGAITLTVNGGTSPYSYNWSNGATTQNLANLTSGTYTVSITDANGCTAIQSQVVTQPSVGLSASANVSQSVSCNGGNNAAINVTVNGGTAPYSFNWSNGAATQNVNNLAAGTYTVTVTDANSCTEVQTVTITQPSSGLSASSTVTGNISCFSGNNGSIDLTINGGTLPYNYNWNTGATTEDLSGLSAGNYSVTVTDANGCTTIDNATITQPAGSLSTSISLTQGVLCNGGNNGSINLTVTGGTLPYTYNWSNGASSQDISNLSAGIYTVTITDANGCFAGVTGTITQPSASLSATASVTQNVNCYSGTNGAITLTVNGGTSPYSYNWSNAATTQNISNLNAGTYSVSITDANGCTFTQSATVTQPTGSLSATASATQNVSCNGGANGIIDLTVNGGTSPYTFNWSNGATTEDINNLSAGTYIVSITDVNGCITSQNAVITQPTGSLAANISASQNVACYGGTNGTIDLTVIGGTSPYSFNWNNGASTEDISNLSAGTYTVSITDANGCTETQTGLISQPSGGLAASTTVTGNISCFSGNNGSIDLAVSGGTMPYSYNWNTGATTEDLINLSAGTYTVSITDANGCTSNSAATITQPAGSLATNVAINQQVSCYGGANGSINLTASGGTAPYSYSWSNGSSTEDINGLASGTYTVTVTDVNGCSASTSAGITQPSGALSANTSVSQNVSCNSGSNGSMSIIVSGGTSPYIYDWSTGASTQSINGLNAGTYTVTITDANGCTTIQSGTITQPSGALSATSSANQNVSCYGGVNGAITLNVNGGTAPYSYNWSNGATTQNISSLTSGTYTVSITDANGCTANQSQ
ncbi:MAG: SprB repeat-containing protein, partial [Bacteroidota bacterium]